MSTLNDVLTADLSNLLEKGKLDLQAIKERVEKLKEFDA